MRPLKMAAAVMAAVTIGLAAAPAANAANGTVAVTGTNNGTISVSIADASADFGTNLAPDGTDSSSSDSVVDYQGSTGNQGSYYVWRAAGSGLGVTVRSNQVWNGTVDASANSGTATSLSIASGALGYCTAAPASYAAAAACTDFATSAATWQTNHAKGNTTFTYYYALRVDWDDDPGTFISTVTYAATQ
jgi:hypothetical protein